MISGAEFLSVMVKNIMKSNIKWSFQGFWWKKNTKTVHNDIPSGINPSGQQQFIYISAPSPAKMGHSLLQAVK